LSSVLRGSSDMPLSQRGGGQMISIDDKGIGGFHQNMIDDVVGMEKKVND
jgi:hypothetical protein